MDSVTHEEELFSQLVLGSHSAFEALFELHVDFVFNVAVRRTGSQTEAEEIVSETFFELWRQRSRIHPRHGSLRPWLTGTVANKCRHFWRRGVRERRALHRLEIVDDAVSEDPAEDVVTRAENRRAALDVREALDQLPDAQWLVVTLWAWERHTHEEIAEALGIAVGTVKSRLARARRRLERISGTPAGERASSPGGPTETVGEIRAIGAEGRCT